MMEKRGDISNQSTPVENCCGGRCSTRRQPMDKQAADRLERSPQNDAIDAVVAQTNENASK